MIEKPTCIRPYSSTLIDRTYICTSRDCNYTLTEVIDLGLNNQALILTTRKSNSKADQDIPP